MDPAVKRLTVPSTLESYLIDQSVVEFSEDFLQDRGSEGLEAVVLWLGSALDDETAHVSTAYVPEQIARRSSFGVSVEITRAGLSRLIADLPEGVFVLARVHSHPTDAYHSDVDDENMVISHPRAISVVVPFFAKAGIRLTECSVNELVHGKGWRELEPEEVERRFKITTGTAE